MDPNNLINGVINLNIDVLHTNPTAAYTFTSPNNRYKDWVNLLPFMSTVVIPNTTATTLYLTSIHYLQNKINLQINAPSPLAYYVPHLFPIVLDFQFSTTSITGCSVTPCKAFYQTVINGPPTS